MPKSPALWEPYCHRADAEFHLSNFAGRVLGPKAGVIFFDGLAAARLKPALPDADGHALDLVVSASRFPLAAPDPLSNASPQTIAQLSHAWSQRVAAASGPTALDRGLAATRQFMGEHKIAFGAAAVAGDAFGVLAGVVSLGLLFAGGAVLLPALGVVAGAASAVLLFEDGKMLYYELTGDEVHRKALENSWHYKLVETIGPILLLPDLAFSGVRTLASLPRLSREAGEAAEEAAQAVKRLANQRKDIDAFTRNNLDHPNQALMREQANQMRGQASGFANDVREAQRKLDKAHRELMLVRTIGAPAYLTTTYGTGVYGVNSPNNWPEIIAWVKEHTHQFADHAAGLLMPPRVANDTGAGDPMTVLQFQVGISRHPEHAQ